VTFHIRTTCRLCSSPSLSTALELPDQPLANEYWDGHEKQDPFPLYIAQCGTCGHVQTPVVVDPVRLFAHDYSYTSGASPVFRAHLDSLAKDLHASGYRSIVDIGSNDGTLIGACRKLGMSAIGVDPACNLAASASASGCLTIPAFFTVETARELVRLLNGSPSVVTALNCFAHADDLGGIADGVAELVGTNGTFIFEVAYVVDLVAKNECGSCYHEHVSHHSLGPLLPFFRARELEVVDVLRSPIQGGSLRVFVKPKGAQAVNEKHIASVLRAEEKLPDALAQWPTRVAAERDQVAEMLAPYRAAEKSPLCVFGAPARLTPWAYAMGMRADDVAFVFDDEPRKIGKFTPGLHWEIGPSEWLTRWNPPAVLIASWNYAANIKARFPDYHGQWLVPPREPVEKAA
jgi:hypothetical protein